MAEGLAHAKAERWPKAIDALAKAVRMKPDPMVARELGKVLYAVDKLPLARRRLEQATQLAPNDAESFLYFGMVLAEMDQRADARRAYERFLQLEPAGSPRAREITSVLKTLER